MCLAPLACLQGLQPCPGSCCPPNLAAGAAADGSPAPRPCYECFQAPSLEGSLQELDKCSLAFDLGNARYLESSGLQCHLHRVLVGSCQLCRLWLVFSVQCLKFGARHAKGRSLYSQHYFLLLRLSFDALWCWHRTLYVCKLTTVLDMHANLCGLRWRDSRDKRGTMLPCSLHANLCGLKWRVSRDKGRTLLPCSLHANLCGLRWRDSRDKRGTMLPCSLHANLCGLKWRVSRDKGRTLLPCSLHANLCGLRWLVSRDKGSTILPCSLQGLNGS